MTRLALAAILALAACADVETREAPVRRGALVLDGLVTRVRDADTVIVWDPRASEKPVPVRLRGVAAPELSEPGGKEAKAWIERAVLGKRVTCSLTGAASYDRQVGFCGTYTDLGAAVIEAGMARECPALSDGRYAQLEQPAALPVRLPPYCEAKP
jgi:micrococcal nuclease